MYLKFGYFLGSQHSFTSKNCFSVSILPLPDRQNPFGLMWGVRKRGQKILSWNACFSSLLTHRVLELEGNFDLTQSDSARLIREETEARRREGISPGEPTLVAELLCPS